MAMSLTQTTYAQDLRRAVPPDCHLAIYGCHNVERDYQRLYGERIWQTILDERIGERLLEIVTSQVSEDKL